MPGYLLIFLCFFGIFSGPCAALDSKDFLPPEQAFKLTVTASSREQLSIHWEIADGYHLYRDRIKFQSQNPAVKLGQSNMPEGVTEHDAVFGEVTVYRDQLDVTLPISTEQSVDRFDLLVKYQGCADAGVCYPPQKQVVEVALPTQSTTEPSTKTTLNSVLQGVKGFAPGLFGDELLPPEQAFQFVASIKDANTLRVSWHAAEGYYLYKDKLQLALDGQPQTRLGKFALPNGEGHFDVEFGQVEIFHGEVSADVPLLRGNGTAETITLQAKYQGCADRGVCYPPMQSKVELALPVAQPGNVAANAVPDAALSEQDRIVRSLHHENLLLTLLSFFGFGLLLSFTPCVFPMLPILSGIVVGHGHQISTRKAFLLSLSYVVASALMYTVFGILAALFGSNLQATFQEPWVIAVFGSVFVLLSLSMFGFYDLQLPKTLQTMAMLRSSSDKHRDGSYLGAAIMGAFASLIVGPCVAAPLAAALIYIGQTGDVWLGGSALFAMGMGMGLPLLLIGASAGKLLPKAGEWMSATKAVFGVLMLAVALWMLSRILPSYLTMLLGSMLLIIPSIYLGAIEPLPTPASGWRKLWKGLGLLMLTFGVLQLIGLSAGSRDPLQPLKGLALKAESGEVAGLKFERVGSIDDLDDRLKQATAKGQRVMLDFYADWCVSCKEMEAYTFTDANVKQQLASFVLLQADVTGNTEADKALLKRFGLVGPPGIIFFGANGQEQANSRVIGYQNAATFSKTLQAL